MRTAAEGATEDELERDMLRLNAQWKQISELAKKAKPGSLLYKEPALAIRLIREEFTKEYRGVVIDHRGLYEEVRGYIDQMAPELEERIEYYDPEAENLPIFEKFHVHEQLHKALDRKVWLPSGGSIIVERTEALTVIDVNTGKNVGASNLEETVYRNNLEAAEAVARELRLARHRRDHRHRLHRHGDQGEPRVGRECVPRGARTRQDPYADLPDLGARPDRDDAQARVGRIGRGVLVDVPALQRAWIRRRRIDVRLATLTTRAGGVATTPRASNNLSAPLVVFGGRDVVAHAAG